MHRDKSGLVEIFGILFLTTDSGLPDYFIAVSPLPFDFSPQKTWAHLHLVSKAVCLTVAKKTRYSTLLSSGAGSVTCVVTKVQKPPSASVRCLNLHSLNVW